MKIEVHSPTVRRREMDAVLTQLVLEEIGPGEQSQRFLQYARDCFGFDFALALRSPVIALSLALRMLKSGGGSVFSDSPPLVYSSSSDGMSLKTGVLLSALSPRYYMQVIRDADMIPVIVDVSAASCCVSAETLRAAVERTASEIRISCVVIHETLGFLPNMTAIAELGIPVIEDCSAAYGATLGGVKAGSFGVLSILGLEERDMLTGGGGALLFAVERRNASVLRGYAGLPGEYGLPDMNAALAMVQMREFVRNAEKRATITGLYTDAALRGGRHKMLVQADDFEYNHYAFPLVLETGMKDVTAYAKKKEIAVENAFDQTIAGTGLAQNELCPNAASLCLRTALFPLYPRLGEEAAQRVAKLIQTLP